MPALEGERLQRGEGAWRTALWREEAAQSAERRAAGISGVVEQSARDESQQRQEGDGGDAVSFLRSVGVHASVSHANGCGVSAGKPRAMCVSCSSLSGSGRNGVTWSKTSDGRSRRQGGVTAEDDGWTVYDGG